MTTFFRIFIGVFVCLALLPFAGICQTVPAAPAWVQDIGGPNGNIISTIVKLDAQDNMYITGIYSGTVDFDPSAAGVSNLTSVSGSFDGYVVKYDPTGALVWARSFGGSQTDQPNGLDVDQNGNVTLIGQFNSAPMDADPGPSVFNLNAVDRDAFIIRLNSSGNFVWAKAISSPATENGSKVATDAAGNLVAVAQFQGTITVGGDQLSPKGGTDGLVVKYDAAGNTIWKFSLGAAGGGDNSVIGALTDNNNNITIAGYINGAVDYNPLGTANIVTANNSMFIAQYSSAGILNWVQIVNGSSGGFNYNINLAKDAQNNTYMDGVFSSPLTFNSSNTLSPQGSQDIFVSKFSPTGALQWAKDIGGSGAFTNNYGITVSADNNVYVSGYFTGTTDFDPSASVANVSYHGIRDMFLAKYNANGAYQWAFGLGNTSCDNNLARYVAVNSANEVILSGSFCSTVNFDASGCSARNVTAQSYQRDLFIAKYVPVVLNISNNNITAPAVTGFCGSGDPEVITGSTPISTIPGITYQWQSSADNVTFTDINGARSKSYDPPFINATTYYRRTVSAGTCLIPSISNVVTISTTGSSDNVITGPMATTFCTLGQPLPILGSAMGPAYTYQWQISDDNQTFRNIGNAVSQDYRPPALSTTVYYYRRVISSVFCSAGYSNVVSIAAVDGNVPVKNTITAPAVTQFCGSGNPEPITGNALQGNGVTYQWEISMDNVSFAAIPNATAADFDPPATMGTTNSTSYYRRVAFATGCNTPVPSNVVSITFTTLDNDLITAPAVTSFCGSGDPQPITGSTPTGGTDTYTYQWSSSTDNITFTKIPGATSKDYDPPLLTTTTYFFRTVHSGNCESTGTITVTINIDNGLPQANNTIAQQKPDGVLCAPNANPALITGSMPTGGNGNFTYQWQRSSNNTDFTDITGSTDKDYDPSPITVTTYYRRLITSAGCGTPPVSNVVTITVASPIADNTIEQIVPNPPACSGPVSVFPIYGKPASGGAGTYTYLWQSSTDGKNFADIPNSNVPNYDPDEISVTTYYRRIVSSGSGCVADSRSNVIAIVIISPTNVNTITAPSVSDFCVTGDALPITSADAGGTDTFTYQWQSSTDNITFSNIAGATTQNYDPPSLTATAYYRRIAISGICGTPSTSNVVAININPEPVASVSQAVSICSAASTTLNASGGTTYSWSPAIGLSATDIASPVASPLTTTTYKVTVANGICTDSAFVTVTVIPQPVVTAGADMDVLKGSSVQLKGKVAGTNVQYSWSPATYLSDPNIAEPIATPTENITYTLTATTDKGCFIVTDDVSLKVYENIVIPNTFTPNGDGTNDTWNITALNTFAKSTVTVFNRYGSVVYRSAGYSVPWDGTYKHQLVPFGSYYYIIDLKDGSKVLSGWLAVVR